ncbi:MAG: NlpC/P60 family protein, partial [Streptosporangiaceae bacterium]
STPAAGAAATAKPETAYVDVSVATLWTSPDRARPVDTPSITNPVHIRRWLAGMSLSDKLWLVGELQTQTLYGHEVYVLEHRGSWVKVAVPGQPTPKNALGYPGWMPAAQLAHSAKYAQRYARYQDRPFALVDGAPTAWLYRNAHLSKKFMEVSYNTRLPVIARTPHAIRVATPTDGKKWLSADDATVYRSTDAIPKPSGDDLVRTAKMFEGLPYLWAGRSGFGFDCSGFTSTVYQGNGIVIPRDASDQALRGGATPVDLDHLRKGDLLFYAHDGGEGYIHHVGMYIGDGKEIDAPINSATEPSPLEIVKVAEHRYVDEYWGAVRYLR